MPGPTAGRPARSASRRAAAIPVRSARRLADTIQSARSRRGPAGVVGTPRKQGARQPRGSPRSYVPEAPPPRPARAPGRAGLPCVIPVTGARALAAGRLPGICGEPGCEPCELLPPALPEERTGLPRPPRARGFHHPPGLRLAHDGLAQEGIAGDHVRDLGVLEERYRRALAERDVSRLPAALAPGVLAGTGHRRRLAVARAPPQPVAPARARGVT